MKKKFGKLPESTKELTAEELLKIEKRVLGGVSLSAEHNNKSSRQQKKVMSLKFPEVLYDDLRELSNRTGQTMTAIIIEILLPAVRGRIRDTE